MIKYLLLLILLVTKASGQITFETTFAGTDNQYGYSVQQTYDGGYVITGQNLNLPYYRNLLLIRTDSLGDTLWTKIYAGDTVGLMGHTVLQTIDSGFIICGRALDSVARIFLLRTDSNGNLLWTKRFGSPNTDALGSSMKQTPDSCFIICGSYLNQNGSYQVLVIKTNSLGDTLWSKLFLYPSSLGTSIDITHDNNYIVAGESGGTPLILKLDVNGNIIFLKQYSVSGHQTRIRSTSDGGFILSGYTFQAADGDAFLLKLDSIGNVLWTKSFHGPLNYNDWGETVIETTDSSYVLAIEAYSNLEPGIQTIKVDKNGNLLWSRINDGINLSGCNYDAGIFQTSDDGFIMTGYRKSPVSHNMELYLIKMDVFGNSGCNISTPSVIDSSLMCTVTSSPLLINTFPGIIDSITFSPMVNQSINVLCSTLRIQNEKLLQDELQIFPNPAFHQFNIHINRIDTKQLEVYTFTGEKIISRNIHGLNSLELNCDDLSSGIYFVKIIFENGNRTTSKVSILK